jgi:hypothetical protein
MIDYSVKTLESNDFICRKEVKDAGKTGYPHVQN